MLSPVRLLLAWRRDVGPELLVGFSVYLSDHVGEHHPATIHVDSPRGASGNGVKCLPKPSRTQGWWDLSWLILIPIGMWTGRMAKRAETAVDRGT